LNATARSRAEVHRRRYEEEEAMNRWIIAVGFSMTLCPCYAGDVKPTDSADGFIRQVVQSLLDEESTITFEVSDKVFAVDNGEVLSKEDLKQAWPEFAKRALKKKVSVDQFFRDIELRVTSPLENKRLMSNKRVLEVYKHEDGDLYCDASRTKEGVENFIAYDKAFIYIIRKSEGKWTLIGIGG
jgi:hypothetical protein